MNRPGRFNFWILEVLYGVYDKQGSQQIWKIGGATIFLYLICKKIGDAINSTSILN